MSEQKPTVGRITFGPLDAPAPQPDRLAQAMQMLTATDTRPCNCIGPQPGQTLCPCVLRAEIERGAQMVRDGVTINGRRYRLVPED